MKKNSVALIILVNANLLVGCYSLQTVNDYAGAAAKNLESFTDLKVNFADSYRNTIKRDSVEKHDFNNKPALQRDLDALFAPNKQIKQFELADLAVNQLVTVLAEYYAGLQQLSNNKLITFDPKFESLGTVLKDSSTLGLSQNESSAYRNPTNFVGNAALNGYRRKKLASYIEEAYEPVKVLLAKLDNLAEIMISELENQKSKAMTSYTHKVSYADSSYIIRLNLAREYKNEYTELSQRIKQFTTYRKMLKVLRKSHEEVYLKRNKWDKEELRKAIMANITELRKLKADFDKLK